MKAGRQPDLAPGLESTDPVQKTVLWTGLVIDPSLGLWRPHLHALPGLLTPDGLPELKQPVGWSEDGEGWGWGGGEGRGARHHTRCL